MTDREMLVEIGEEINRLKNTLHAFQGLMMEFRVQNPLGGMREPFWPPMLERIQSEPSHQAVIQQRSAELKAAIPLQASESQLIRALHDFFLEKT